MIWMSHLDSDLAGSLYAPVILASPVLQSARRRRKKGRRERGRRGRGGKVVRKIMGQGGQVVVDSFKVALLFSAQHSSLAMPTTLCPPASASTH